METETARENRYVAVYLERYGVELDHLNEYEEATR